jgi:hypothetical protein
MMANHFDDESQLRAAIAATPMIVEERASAALQALPNGATHPTDRNAC